MTMRRPIWIALLLIFVSALVVLLLGQVAVWDGEFPLSVRIENKQDLSIRAVRCEAFGHQAEAQYVVDQTIARQPCDLEMKEIPYAGDALEIHVPCFGKDLASLPIHISRGQFEYLAVVAELGDGTRLGKVAAIPDGRVSRSLTVELP